MRTLLLVTMLLAAPLAFSAVPAAQACPDTGCTFGECWVVWDTVWVQDPDGNGVGVKVARGIECAW